MTPALLEVTSLTKGYHMNQSLFRTKIVPAVTDVSFSIQAGEIYGLVGESGSGKTTISRCLVNLESYQKGSICFQGHDRKSRQAAPSSIWHQDMQMVFQNHLASLDPKQTISAMFTERLKIYQRYQSHHDSQRQIIQCLEQVGLKEEHLKRYPHQFSGGQLQRIAIARALIAQPQLLICDEPVSALDVSIQAQILNLLKQLNINQQLAMLFISHDISVIHYLADRIGVLYRGTLVEEGTKKEIFDHPRHPYTQLLLGKQSMKPTYEQTATAGGTIGCNYHPLCSKATKQCQTQPITQINLSDTHYVRCCHD